MAYPQNRTLELRGREFRGRELRAYAMPPMNYQKPSTLSKAKAMLKATFAKVKGSSHHNSKDATKTKHPSELAVDKDHRASPIRRENRMPNGLLNLKRTPDHLLGIVQGNATESPLLRLPGEIRNMIWEYAMGGEVIEIYVDVRPETRDMVYRMRNGLGFPLLVPAFDLPRVCRQIYDETAILTFSRNTFHFTDMDMVDDWAYRLLPAQSNAITAIELHSSEIPRYNPAARPSRPLTYLFPSLTRIYVSKPAVLFFKFLVGNGGTWTDFHLDQEHLIECIIRNKEGQDVEVVIQG